MRWAEDEGIEVHYKGMGKDIMHPMASACYSAWRTSAHESRDMKVVGWYLPEDPFRITSNPDVCVVRR